MRVDVPDLRPDPGVLKEKGGDIPECISRLNDIFLRMVFTHQNLGKDQVG